MIINVPSLIVLCQCFSWGLLFPKEKNDFSFTSISGFSNRILTMSIFPISTAKYISVIFSLLYDSRQFSSSIGYLISIPSKSILYGIFTSIF